MIRKQNNAGTDMPIILFDGVCNLCESTVHFVVRRDRNKQFRFASLQSEAAEELLSSHQYAFDTLSSVLLIVDDTLYRKSRAALQIVRRLDGAWPIALLRYCSGSLNSSPTRFTTSLPTGDTDGLVKSPNAGYPTMTCASASSMSRLATPDQAEAVAQMMARE